MLSQSFHVITEKSPIADDFARALRRVGLSPVFFSLRQMLSEQLTPLGIGTPHVFEKGIEVYTSSDQKKAVLARSGRDDQAGRHVWFVDFVVLSREAPFELLVRAIEENLELEVLDHS